MIFDSVMDGKMSKDFAKDVKKAVKGDEDILAVKEVDRKLSKESFEYLKEIGTGSYGKVHQVKNKQTMKEYAMKEIAKFQIQRLGKH